MASEVPRTCSKPTMLNNLPLALFEGENVEVNSPVPKSLGVLSNAAMLCRLGEVGQHGRVLRQRNAELLGHDGSACGFIPAL